MTESGLISSEGINFYHGKGCEKCLHTGYKGRIGIFEIMLPDDEIRALIVSKASSTDIRKAAIKNGMRSIKEDGIEKVKSGVTTLEEILRVTQQEE